MLRRIILLCDEVERPFLTESLTAGAPDLSVVAAEMADLAAMDDATLAEARLVAFCSPAIVPEAQLARLGHGACNFHPGPPTYPGWMPAAFAVYDGAREFGATAHRMNRQVDDGEIIGVEMFPVAPGTSRAELAKQAYLTLLRLFRQLAPTLARDPDLPPPLPIAWTPRKVTRALFAALCDIPLDIEAGELRRRLAAFGDGDGLSVPTVWLHGVPFRHEKPSGD